MDPTTKYDHGDDERHDGAGLWPERGRLVQELARNLDEITRATNALHRPDADNMHALALERSRLAAQLGRVQERMNDADDGHGEPEPMVSVESVREALRAGHANDSAADQVEYVSELVGWCADDDAPDDDRDRAEWLADQRAATATVDAADVDEALMWAANNLTADQLAELEEQPGAHVVEAVRVLRGLAEKDA